MSIRPVVMRRGVPSKHEVIVTFVDVETRDRVSSYARNLGTWIDMNGKPTAGIRHEVPTHLGGVHRTLQQYGYAMWMKLDKNKEFKRNIRHDDSEMSYCLDIKLPNKSNWITVSYRRALDDRRASTSSEINKLGDELSTAGIVVVEEDATSASIAPGSLAEGGSITTTSWRAPTNCRK